TDPGWQCREVRLLLRCRRQFFKHLFDHQQNKNMGLTVSRGNDRKSGIAKHCFQCAPSVSSSSMHRKIMISEKHGECRQIKNKKAPGFECLLELVNYATVIGNCRVV